MKFGFETLDAKIDGVRDDLKGTREELSAKIQVVGEKVSGHEERIVALERKVACSGGTSKKIPVDG
ncbi:MAG: hypothetical protein Q9M27_07590 [Mariprofundaceae bacterium]|nr:hypothetical protein [Mariprofundaceae bacterium]